MVIHLTRKLSVKLHVAELTAVPVAAGAHLRWYSNSFLAERTQYILTVNAASLFAVVLYGRGIADVDSYVKRFLSALREQLESEGMQSIFRDCIEPWVGSVTLARTEDRSVLGSMNDMMKLCKHRLQGNSVSPRELSDDLNGTPFGAITYGFPREAFAAIPRERGTIG